MKSFEDTLVGQSTGVTIVASTPVTTPTTHPVHGNDHYGKFFVSLYIIYLYIISFVFIYNDIYERSLFNIKILFFSIIIIKRVIIKLLC